MLIVIGCILNIAACGGGGGSSGDSGGSSVNTATADLTGNWSGNSNGSAYALSVMQTGNTLHMTQTSDVIGQFRSIGAVAGNSADVATLSNATGVTVSTSTLALLNTTTANMTMKTCTPEQGYSCAVPGTVITLTRPAPVSNFSGTWTGNSNGTAFAFSIGQTGSNFSMTRTAPALSGVTYTGAVTGSSASVNTYINGALAGISTLTLTNNTTATMTVNTCTPPQGYSCAAPGTEISLTRTPPISNDGVLKALLMVPANAIYQPDPSQANPLVLEKVFYSISFYGENSSGSGSTVTLHGLGGMACVTPTTCTNVAPSSSASFAKIFTLTLEGDGGATINNGLDFSGATSGATYRLTMAVQDGATVQKVLIVR